MEIIRKRHHITGYFSYINLFAVVHATRPCFSMVVIFQTFVCIEESLGVVRECTWEGGDGAPLPRRRSQGIAMVEVLKPALVYLCPVPIDFVAQFAKIF